jgi:pyruvate kinase
MPHSADFAAAGISQRHLLTTIVATIGPKSDSPEMVSRLIQSGVGVFRFNFSHGDLEAHSRRLATVRAASAALGITVACLGDLQGPKIRVGKVPEGVGMPHPSGGSAIDASPGHDVVFKKGIDAAFMRERAGVIEAVLPVTYQPLVDEVEVGHKVLINDGAIRMLAVEKDGDELRCRVVVGGLISSGKGINVPQSALSAPAITERDWECAAWAVQNDLDFLALSFVRSPDDIELFRAGMANMIGIQPGTRPDQGAWIPIIAKVEMPQAVERLDEIVCAADGIMVARGDLGVEMDIAMVPVVQKQIVRTCGQYGKPCIVATQMLESMIENSSPTRAEATDVANAIFDGADAVMLSAETATGKHPVLVVETMARILKIAEAHIAATNTAHSFPTKMGANHKGTAALAHGAWQIASDLGAKAVVVWSQHGGTARYLSQNRFHIPIVAYSSDTSSCRRMTLLRGVTPVLAQPPASGMLSEWNEIVDQSLQRMGVVRAGDPIILLAGRPLGQAKRTNTMAIHRVGEPTGFRSTELA